jgi:hypothetical protein
MGQWGQVCITGASFISRPMVIGPANPPLGGEPLVDGSRVRVRALYYGERQTAGGSIGTEQGARY